ncbi:MAG: hypothetical protein RR144_05070, partial [Clostridia bacterium]
MKKKLVKFILISILIIILCVIYLFYINSNEYKKEHKIKVVENMNILVNDIYVSNTNLSSYNWNEGKIEEGL